MAGLERMALTLAVLAPGDGNAAAGYPGTVLTRPAPSRR